MDALIPLIILIAVIYAGMCGYLYLFQRSLIYHPVVELAEPHNYGMDDAKAVTLATSDNEKIIAWYIAPKRHQPLMVYFHGNAGNLADRVEKLKTFTANGMGMLAVSWRGYGGSSGHPTEQGLYNDARAAIAYVHSLGLKPEDFFVYGESLGSGVAIQMAMEFPFRALVLEAPYTSITNRAKEKYPYIPTHLLLKDHFNSLAKISSVHIPLMIFHGYRDDVMPISHSRRLLVAANEPKEARFFDQVAHTNFDVPEIAGLTQEFVQGAKR